MSGNLSRSMRENYGTHGVDEYYKIVGSSYRNPHFPGIKQSINTLMNKWWQNEITHAAEAKKFGILMCDLAAGSGEVTIALQEWWETCRNRATATPNLSQPTSRPAVARPAVGRPSVARPQTTVPSLLAPFPTISPTDPVPRIVAVDPYTADAYLQRTGLPCIALSFQDVAQDGLPEPPPSHATPGLGSSIQESNGDPPSASASVSASTPEPSEPQTHGRELYDLVICSFALHLVTSPGALFALLSTLSYSAKWLVVLEPHKKPEIKDGWGWALWDVASWKETELGPGKEGDFVKERVHTRVYKSTNL
ncbi:hypothetical protein FRC07_010133 [Ceratobasidium sp. 392]|nr:hypothetical protein FRC07_010133 [Ceratobasidium sp. 392]